MRYKANFFRLLDNIQISVITEPFFSFCYGNILMKNIVFVVHIVIKGYAYILPVIFFNDNSTLKIVNNMLIIILIAADPQRRRHFSFFVLTYFTKFKVIFLLPALNALQQKCIFLYLPYQL